MSAKKRFDMVVAIEKPGMKLRWLKIGWATMLDEATGRMVGTVASMPINWNGEFQLMPSERKPQEEANK